MPIERNYNDLFKMNTNNINRVHKQVHEHIPEWLNRIKLRLDELKYIASHIEETSPRLEESIIALEKKYKEGLEKYKLWKLKQDFK